MQNYFNEIVSLLNDNTSKVFTSNSGFNCSLGSIGAAGELIIDGFETIESGGFLFFKDAVFTGGERVLIFRVGNEFVVACVLQLTMNN